MTGWSHFDRSGGFCLPVQGRDALRQARRQLRGVRPARLKRLWLRV